MTRDDNKGGEEAEELEEMEVMEVEEVEVVDLGVGVDLEVEVVEGVDYNREVEVGSRCDCHRFH